MEIRNALLQQLKPLALEASYFSNSGGGLNEVAIKAVNFVRAGGVSTQILIVYSKDIETSEKETGGVEESLMQTEFNMLLTALQVEAETLKAVFERINEDTVKVTVTCETGK